LIKGRVQKFGDHIDTDAIIPAEFMPGTSDKDLGSHCFQYVRPDFRERCTDGFSIVVAGTGFGSGSSREEAPRALKGCGVQAVIARSFAFIYGRNQSNMALLGLTPEPFDEFYQLVSDGSQVEIDLPKRSVKLVLADGSMRCFPFTLSQMEERLLLGGGVTNLYKRYGSELFRVALSGPLSSDDGDSDGLPLSPPPPTSSPSRKGGLIGLATNVKPRKQTGQCGLTDGDDCQSTEKW
jgi:3-isopropylmalate dehydratase small subunit